MIYLKSTGSMPLNSPNESGKIVKASIFLLFEFPISFFALVCLCIWTTWVVVSHIVILFAPIFFVRYYPFTLCACTRCFSLVFFLFFTVFSLSSHRNEQTKWTSLSKLRQRFKNFIFWHESKQTKKKISCSLWVRENGMKCWTFEQFKRKHEGILDSCYICRMNFYEAL